MSRGALVWEREGCILGFNTLVSPKPGLNAQALAGL